MKYWVRQRIIMGDELRARLLKVQNLIRRDPDSYIQEFKQYFSHYKKLFNVYVSCGVGKSDEILLLTQFIGCVISNYTESCNEFLKLMLEAVKSKRDIQHEFRLEACKLLIRYQQHPIISIDELLFLFLRLFQQKHKQLRQQLFKIIIATLKLNQSSKNKCQSVLYRITNEIDSPLNTQYASLCILFELWRRNVWRDEKVSNAISKCVFSNHYRVSYQAMMMLCGKLSKITQFETEECDEKDDEIRKDAKRNRVHMSSRSAKKRQRREESKIKKLEKNKKIDAGNGEDTSMIRMLYDAHDFGEKLFKHVTKSSHRFEYKLLGIEVVTRVVVVHQLILPSIFQFCLKYLHPHQTGVVKILASLIQATHSLVPPEITESLVECIVNNFVSLQNAPEICAVGINAVRELYSRNPHCINSIIAQDLVNYARDRKAEKAVLSAARSLINLLQVIKPDVLPRRIQTQRVNASVNDTSNMYGSVKIHTDVPGVERLKESFSDDDTDRTSTDEEEDDICGTRLLSAHDFEKLERIKRKNAANESDAENDVKGDAIVKVQDVGTVYGISSRHKNKDESEEHVKVNPHKGWRFNARASSTNTEKKRNKPFLMLKQKREVKNKKSRSFKQRLQSLKRALANKHKNHV